ncbi:MAG: hypothetical protein JW864_08635 [Spirochaetes bacterium]|nr:hypothetical protein [Spirochaetota bacterium]
MQRFALIIITLLSMYKSIYAVLPVDFLLESGYKHDTIDYSETENTYYREKMTVFFSRESSFNLSCIRLQNSGINKYTWNLTLNDISPLLSFQLGNYFVNFGTGLLIGRKKQYDPDIFRTADLRAANTFSACKSGNPVYAFNGIAAISYFKMKYLEISLNMFYSIQERFISQDAYDSGEIPSSLNSIDSNLTELNTKNELIEIHTRGAMFSATLFKYISVQTYTVMTDLKSFYKEDINWEYEETFEESAGISQLTGVGCMARYKDDYLCIVTDHTITKKEMLLNEKTERTEYGHGSLYGLEFDHPFIMLALTGKHVESSFYSPYSSSAGDTYPESACFFNTEMKPFSNFNFKTQISSQKRNMPSSLNKECPVTNIKNFSILYKYGPLEKIQIELKTREKTDEEKEKRTQLKSTVNYAIIDCFILYLAGLYQTDENSTRSSLFQSGFKLDIKNNFKINFHYLRAKISEDNDIYSITSPVRNSSTRGFFIRETSEFIIAKADVKISSIHLSGRYAFQFTGKKSITRRFEFYISGYF